MTIRWSNIASAFLATVSLPAVQIAVAVVAALALLWGIWWLWWRLPRHQAARLAPDDPKARADVEDNFRKTIGQALGGAVVLFAVIAGYWQFKQQQQTAIEQIVAQQKASQDLLISNQMSRGFEQLASDNLTMRLGGIYELGGVMNASAHYYGPVLEALCSFVRDSTKGKPNDQPAADIQAALTVIGERAVGPGDVDLSGASLARTNLSFALLSGADLSGTNLNGAKLNSADLNRAYLIGANLSGADLSGANLNGADLSNANLSDADLGNANLSDADLRRANLNGADLRGANLNRAALSGADLANALLSNQGQLDQACGTSAKLPTGFTFAPKRCPTRVTLRGFVRPAPPP